MRGPAGPKRAGGVLICYPTVVTVASQKDEGYSSNKPALMASSWVVAGGHMPYRRNCARVLLVGVCRVPSVSSGQQRPASWAVSDKVTFSESCPAAFRRRLRWCCGVPPPPQHTPHRRDLTGNQHHGAVVRRIWAGKRLRGRGWRRWTSRHTVLRTIGWAFLSPDRRFRGWGMGGWEWGMREAGSTHISPADEGTL